MLTIQLGKVATEALIESQLLYVALIASENCSRDQNLNVTKIS